MLAAGARRLMSDPIIRYTVQFTREQFEGLFGPRVSDRKAHWWRCFEAIRLARVALEVAVNPCATKTPAAHYAAAVRYLLEAQRERELAKASPKISLMIERKNP